MADRMAVMDGGVLQQYDRPERVFENPVNLFVAGFVGSPAMNFLKTRVANGGTGAVLEGADGWRVALSRNARRALAASSPEVLMGARHSTPGCRRKPPPPPFRVRSTPSSRRAT